MRAVNLRSSPVELAPENGAGMLAPPVEGSDDHVRELETVTDHEEALARAGIILLEDTAGRARTPKAKPAPTSPDDGDAD